MYHQSYSHPGQMMYHPQQSFSHAGSMMCHPHPMRTRGMMHQLSNPSTSFANFELFIRANQTVDPSMSSIQYLVDKIKSHPNDRLSFAQSSIPYCPPFHKYGADVARDISLLKHYQQHGGPKEITTQQWQEIGEKLAANVQRYTTVSTKCCFLFHPTNSTTKNGSSGSEDVVHHDLDLLMTSKNCNCCIVHTEYVALTVTFSKRLCKKILSHEEIVMGINTEPNMNVKNGIRLTTELDKSQIKANGKNESLNSAHYGACNRTQKYSPTEITTELLVGSRKLAVSSVNIPSCRLTSFQSPSQIFYDQHCWPVLQQAGCSSKKKRLAEGGKQYGSRGLFRLPFLRLSSAPTTMPQSTHISDTEHIDIVLASCYESYIARRMAEHLLHIFSAIPYSTTPYIAYMNEQTFFTKNNIHPKEYQWSRPFPQGTLGVSLEKQIHDDANGLLVPGLWQCLASDPLNPVRFVFQTTNMSYSFQSSKKRFAWFNGMIPHKTEAIHVKFDSDDTRVHHSAYWKPVHEYISLVLMAQDNADLLSVSYVSST